MSAPIITMRGVCKRFGEYPVLQGVDLDVAEGGITVIIGGSGSGKTVLVKHMIGLLRPDAGEIVVDGEDVGRLRGQGLTRLRGKFGMVFQGAALFDSMTVWENVAFPLVERRSFRKAEIRERVADKLRILGLSGAERKYPAELSGGMKKRVGLARAVVLNPKIMIYDEPTTGLDPITTRQVDEMILEAQATFQVTSVVISHDMASTFRIADHVAFVDRGVIAAFGTAEEFIRTESERVRDFVRSSGVALERARAGGAN
jgi:phospholipid/cholesterol/gamma-HCH transport system ATP-binding protein